ncbi:hypothetical protein EYF80_043234 [Liparis tanakae]|uniref:Uncharacterized protein n=1 Tax=Liparis tanakae TaxID=230148 RepID=A0A4Z2G081_9TELE|nr:hypothetical protein EYF80_043234 [Liparis tanakae]
MLLMRFSTVHTYTSSSDITTRDTPTVDGLRAIVVGTVEVEVLAVLQDGGGDHLDLLVKVSLRTVHGEPDVALPGEGVVGDGDLHLVGPFVRQLQAVEQQRAVLEHQDAVAVLRPQVPDDVGPDGLHHGDGLLPVPPELPLDDGLVGAAAGVADGQEGLFAHRAPHHRGRAGHVHPGRLAWGEEKAKRRRQ